MVDGRAGSGERASRRLDARVSTGLAISSLAVAALGSVVVLFDSDPPTLSPVVVSAIALIGVGFGIAAWREVRSARLARITEEAAWREKLSGLLRVGLRHGRLPRLSELPDYVFGPTPTVYTERGADPYVSRPDADAWLHARLTGSRAAPYPFLVVRGFSKAGKSRTALEAARAHVGDPHVIIARDGQALSDVVRLDPPVAVGPSPFLVWIDDMRVGDLDHLTSDILDELAARAIVIATMSDKHWSDIYYAGSEITTVSRSALQRASHYKLRFELTDAEKANARAAYPERARDFNSPVASVAETLVGGEQLLARYNAGQADSPAGYAVVQAAIDWRRCGLGRPIPRRALESLFPLYLRRVRIDLAATPSRLAEGLEWALEPVASQVALLRPSTSEPHDGWSILDYVVSADDGQGDSPVRAIPNEAWERLLSIVPAHEGLDIGMAAHLRGEPTYAYAAFQMAAATGHPDFASAGAFNLGVLLAEAGDDELAQPWFRSAIDSGHTTDAPAAAVELGLLLRRKNDIDGAGEAFMFAVRSGHPVEAPRALTFVEQLEASRQPRDQMSQHPRDTLGSDPLVEPRSVQVRAQHEGGTGEQGR